MPLPQLQNSPETLCDSGQQCNEQEFAARLAILEKRWALLPDELQQNCAASSTLPVMEQCIGSQTSAWSNAHPNDETPWMDPDLANPG
jgi:hypothetical protein